MKKKLFITMGNERALHAYENCRQVIKELNT